MYRSGRLRDTNTNMNKIGLVHFWVRIWFWAASAKKEKESNPSFHTSVHASRKKNKVCVCVIEERQSRRHCTV